MYGLAFITLGTCALAIAAPCIVMAQADRGMY